MPSFAKEIKIANRLIGDQKPVYIIAEAGVNHNGDIQLAYQLIDIAIRAGADAVKFQLFDTASLIKNDVKKATYQIDSESESQSQYEMLKALEISPQDCEKLASYAMEQGIDFIVTPFDEPSLTFLLTLPISALKISSTDLTNLAFIERASHADIPLILSTGMSEQSEVDEAIEVLKLSCKDLILLQCTSSYPAPTSQLNLRVMNKYAKDYEVIVGYSDHTSGIGASPYAVAAGASVIEKHFTIDKSLPGPDHQASLSPSELSLFIDEIRKVEAMMGREIKRVELCEKENRLALQKCLVAATSITKDTVLTKENMVARRTGGNGFPANFLGDLVGQVAKQDYAPGDIIEQ